MFYGLSNIITINFTNFDTSSVIDMTGMFYGCSQLISLALSNFITSSVTSMCHMFRECNELISLDLSNFNTSSVTKMGAMFYNCIKLNSLDISNFNTSSVTFMNSMFEGCSVLISLDISNFNTSSVINMGYMFKKCKQITFLELSNFDTSSVTTMNSMFFDCNQLISLDLSNFNTSKVTTMGSMFRECNKLISLDISTFNTSLVTDMGSMFCGCKILISLYLNNFNTKSVTSMSNMFSNINSNLIYCINYITLNSNLQSTITWNIGSGNNKCSDICFYRNIKILFDDKKCSLNCSENNKFDYKNICYKTCPNGTYNISNNICKKYNKFNGYTGDIYSSLIIDTDNIYSNTYPYIITNSDKLYSSTNTNMHNINLNSSSTINDNLSKDSISSSIPFKLLNNSDIYNYIEYFNRILIKSNNYSDINTIKIKNELKNGNLDKFIINIIENNKNDMEFNDSNIIYQLTSSYIENNNLNDNLCNIHLGLCEDKLKSFYNISYNSTLLMLKTMIYQKGLLIPIIEYEIYNIKTKKTLDLNICEGIKINISIPADIDENNLFKYNSSDEYYNDICYPYTTENNTDIILKDRRQVFINNNLSLCEKNCSYEGYNYNTKKVLCECSVKIKFTFISEININADILLCNFKDIRNIINIITMKCYYTLFTIDGLFKNMANYIIYAIILITICLVILFKLKEYHKIKSLINEVFEATNVNNLDNNNNNNIINGKIYGNKENIKNTEVIKDNNNNEGINTDIKKIKNKKKRKRKKMRTNGEITDKTNTKLKLKNENIMIQKKKSEKFNLNKIQNILTNNTDINIININKLNDYEINNLSYNNALKYDKRSYIQYYFSLLKAKHLIIFTFYTKNDYNSRIIKVILFLFSFALYFTVNTLFFSDSTMHKIYEDQGIFNLIYQLPQIFYSTIITGIINLIIKYLSLTEKEIANIKKEQNVENNLNVKKSKLLVYFKIKFIIFFILLFSFLILFWYYLSSFCAVYKNTQITLLKNTLISFGLSLIYPFGLNFLPGILRIPSLKSNNKEFLYKVSKIVQLL